MLRGVRGATTIDTNNAEDIYQRTQEMLKTIIAQNGIQIDDIAAAIFTVTDDIGAAFPATAARAMGWNNVPLFDAKQPDCDTGLPLCIRVLVLWNSEIMQNEIKHIYLHNASKLRPDLAEKTF